MNYIEIAAELNIKAQTEGDCTVIEHIQWDRPTDEEIASAWKRIKSNKRKISLDIAREQKDREDMIKDSDTSTKGLIKRIERLERIVERLSYVPPVAEPRP